VLPFTIHADKDLAYLKKGVADMLASRLALKDKIVIVAGTDSSLKTEEIPETIDATTALALGAKSGSDYVLFGSLTILGNNVSTDASFFDIHQKQPLLTFSEVGQAQGEIISHINLLAVRIKEEVFGRKTRSTRPPVAQSSPKPESGSTGRMHPEKLLDKAAGTEIMDSEDRPSSDEMSATLWKTQTFKIEIKGFAIGDVDGDKNNEAVFISSKKVFIYRYVNRRFIKIAELQGPRSDSLGGIDIGVSPDTFIGIDVADINANGTAEIFVTNLSETNRLRSFVLEWNGTEFKTLTQDENWYYRVIKASQKGLPILLGQKGGFTDAFSGPIYALGWDNVRYVTEEKQRLPRRVLVYGLTYGDVLNEGRDSVLVIKKNGILSILDQDGQEEWTSSETYGGSNVYLLSPADMKEKKKEGQQIDPTAGKGLYLQQRIFVTDLNQDKKNEVIVVKNHDVSRGAFHRYRKFTSGHFEGLVWDNVGLRGIWKTRKFSGYISDYDVGDLDNDGTDELVFAVMAKSEGPISDPKSYIVAWSLKK
ncbi:MAG: VCBS repeat-containing protein, partial [Desulfobacterales bacterium]|nr:VCBS repeat-containing protein [Desulfobacterales bacterium]